MRTRNKLPQFVKHLTPVRPQVLLAIHTEDTPYYTL